MVNTIVVPDKNFVSYNFIFRGKRGREIERVKEGNGEKREGEG